MKKFKNISARTLLSKISKKYPDYSVDITSFEKPTLIVNPLKKEKKIRREQKKKIIKELKQLNGGKRVDLSDIKLPQNTALSIEKANQLTED